MFSIKRLSKEEQRDFYRMLDTIQDNEERIAELKAQNDDYKATLERYLDEDGYKDSGVTIYWKKPSETVSIDLKKLEVDDGDLYGRLMGKYSKVTRRGGGFQYKFRKEVEDGRN